MGVRPEGRLNDPFESMFAGLRQPPRVPGVDYRNQPKPQRDRPAQAKTTKTIRLTHPGEHEERWDANPQTRTVQGTQIDLFEVRALGKALGRQAVTVRSWEAKGWLPRAVFRTVPPAKGVPGKENKGRRMYSRHQIELVLRVANETGVLSLSNRGNTADPEAWKEFARRVALEWRAEVD